MRRSLLRGAQKSPPTSLALGELNARLGLRLNARLPDPLAAYPEMAGFDVYAGDGHWHGAAAHDAPLDGVKWAVGHAFALDLRSHALRHLAVAEGKKEHDMHVLKRLDLEHFRNEAAKGRKVLYAWDKAGIDFHFWQRLKQGHGIKLRWDIEKTFDAIKNKLGEKQAWASSPTAKAIQA